MNMFEWLVVFVAVLGAIGAGLLAMIRARRAGAVLASVSRNERKR